MFQVFAPQTNTLNRRKTMKRRTLMFLYQCSYVSPPRETLFLKQNSLPLPGSKKFNKFKVILVTQATILLLFIV